MTKVVIFPDTASTAHKAAEYCMQLAREAAAARGKFAVALSGGRTPRSLYQRLAHPPYSNRIPWNQVHVFWGDERCVPPDHTSCNYRMAWEALLAHIPLPEINIHRPQGDNSLCIQRP